MCLRTTHKSRLYVTLSACDTSVRECHVYGVGFLADSWQQVLEGGATVSLDCTVCGLKMFYKVEHTLGKIASYCPLPSRNEIAVFPVNPIVRLARPFLQAPQLRTHMLGGRMMVGPPSLPT